MCSKDTTPDVVISAGMSSSARTRCTRLSLWDGARNVKEDDRYLTGSPYIDDLIVARWALDEDAMLAVPDAPGFGIALNMDAVEKYTGERFHPHRRELLYPSIN